MSRIYLDHNATSPMPGAVRRAVAEAVHRLEGNPSSPHAEGRSARRLLEEARERVARILGHLPEDVIFTSGGTEANNLALHGLVAAVGGARGGARIVTSKVEHPSILEPCRILERSGVAVTRLEVSRDGVVDPEDLDGALRGRGAPIVSIMHANNETGVIQPLEELARIARRHGAIFHSDMVQSLGRLPVDLPEIDACTVTSHKIGGPAGIGVLALREASRLRPLVTGGPQEGRKRAGTEPVLPAAGLESALRLLEESPPADPAPLRDRLEEEILRLVPRARIHGRGASRLANTCSFFLPNAPGRYLVMQLDLMGIAVSTGSACSTGSGRPSHVLEAMGCTGEEARDSVRVSLGRGNTGEEIERLIGSLGEAITMAGPPGLGARRRAVPETTRTS